MENKKHSYNEEQNVEVKINTNDKKSGFKTAKKRKIFRPLLYFTIFIFTIFAVFSSQVLVSEQDSNSWFYNLPIIKQIKHLAESADRTLKGENADRINVLLLGMGGIKHEGGYLTDTIIIASLEPSTQKVAMVSIPRDLALPVEDMGLQKINSINAYAEMESKNSGGVAISQAISDVLGIPIDYYVRVDFEGFVNIVDELGGVSVDVENTIDDYRYPIKGMEEAEDYESRFEHLHINEGRQIMNGDLALKYARSRHAVGVEGSDFARAKRQQKIIVAVKNKLLSTKLLLQPTTLASIISELHDHISTNLKIWEMLKLWDLFKDINRENIVNKVLDNSPNSLLVDDFTEEGAYILAPRSGDFEEMKYYINNVFSDAPAEDKSRVTKERATIEVRNGTWINGLASQTALDLEKYGFIVVRIGNSSRQNFERTVIYDLSFGEKSESLTILKNRLNANISHSLPEWLISDIEKDLDYDNNPIQPDFVIILGQDADTTSSGMENAENQEE